MTHLHDAECKFCRIKLQVEIEDDYLLLRGGVFGEIPTLVKLASCNRCADYENSKRRIRDATEKAARTLSLEIYARRDASPLAESSRGAIHRLFEKWFDLICNHLLIETQRDENFVRMIYTRPEKWAQAFHLYERSCREIAEDARRGKI